MISKVVELTFVKGCFESVKIAHSSIFVRVKVKQLKLIARLYIFLEFGFSRRVLGILEINNVEDVGPGALLAVDTLR